jgi:hypothetical protein
MPLGFWIGFEKILMKEKIIHDLRQEKDEELEKEEFPK